MGLDNLSCYVTFIWKMVFVLRSYTHISSGILAEGNWTQHSQYSLDAE